MKKVTYYLLLAVILLALPGCATHRASLKTDTSTKAEQTSATVTATESNQQTGEQLAAVLQRTETLGAVIEFEETEYYQLPGDTASGNQERSTATNPRKVCIEDYDPPNAPSLAKRTRKGTITINAHNITKEATQTTKAAFTTEATQAEQTINSSTNTTTDTKQKTTTTRQGRIIVIFAVLGALALLAALARLTLYILKKRS